MQEAMEVLAEHLTFHVVIDEAGFFGFAVNRVTGHELVQGMGAVEHF